jgi:hypothetical protein
MRSDGWQNVAVIVIRLEGHLDSAERRWMFTYRRKRTEA